MSKLYVPEGVWLVCSEGTSTQQLAVVSQSKVTVNDGRLMATIEDKVKTDFGCKKGALLTSIAMALWNRWIGSLPYYWSCRCSRGCWWWYYRQTNALWLCLVYG